MLKPFQPQTRRAGRSLLVAFLLLTAIGFTFAPEKQANAKELVGAMSASWSPDGTQIAYAFFQKDHSDIYLFDVNQHAAIRIANNAGNPVWSPDGTQIAYTADSNGDGEINIVTLATMKRLDLTMGYFARWSPDGKQIAFATYQDSVNTQSLYLTAPDGSSQRKVATGTDQMTFTWSPDGKHIAFTGDCGDGTNAVCVMDSDGSNTHKLSKASATFVSWSPDGTNIAAVITEGISVISADGTGKRDLTVPQPYIKDDQPLWSPDGSRLIFMRMHLPDKPETADNPYTLLTQVYVVNADGSALQMLID